jgi:hypothetical protein
MNIAEATTLWETALAELQLQMIKATYDAWLRGSTVIACDEDNLIVQVRHAYAVDWLEHRLSSLINRTLQRYRPNVTALFVAEQSTLDPEPDPEPDPGIEYANTSTQRTSTLEWTDIYIKVKVALRQSALAKLKGSQLSIWLCLATHMDSQGISSPGIERIMQETGYNSRTTVCSSLDKLCDLGLIKKLPGGSHATDRYQLQGYAWFGRRPAPCLFEE